MNNLIARKIDLTASYQPLASQRTVVTVTLSAPPTNAQTVYVLGDTGQDVPLIPGEWHLLHHVNLADIAVKGTPGDIVTVIGGTW